MIAILADPRVLGSDVGDITVVADGRHLLLGGAVASEAARKAADEVVRAVRNDLRARRLQLSAGR